MSLTEKLIALLGESKSSPAFTEVLNDLGKAGDWDDHKGHAYLNFRESGVSLSYEKRTGSFQSIFLYGNGRDGFSEYRGLLPAGLTFHNTREEVHHKLGEPVRSGPGPEVDTTWDLFQSGDHTVHFEFGADGQPSLITFEMEEVENDN